MKSVPLTKQQLASLKMHMDKKDGIKRGLEALCQALREADEIFWKHIHSIEPKAKAIDWEKKCLLIDE